MSILTVKNLNHGFGDRQIFDNVSFRLLKGEKIGLIGANGEGKSTFINIITNNLTPDEGKVEWSNRVRVGYLDQHANLGKDNTIREELNTAFQWLYDIEQELNEAYMKMGDVDEDEMNKLMDLTAELQDILDVNNFYTLNVQVDKVAKGLGIYDLGLDKNVNDLSGGQRTKILLCKLLLESPDIMILDEPTNYLDEEHITWLKQYLLDYDNAFILISHEVEFLNEVINTIYHLENANLSRYVGDYYEFKRVYEQKKAQLQSAYEKQQGEIANLKDFIARNKARVATTGMASARQKKLDKMDIIELDKEKPKPVFNFKVGITSEKLIFEAKDLVIGYSEPLCKPMNLLLERNMKVAIVGANGLGKSTLIKSLLGEIKALSGKVDTGYKNEIGYFEQEAKEDNYNSCIDELWQEFPVYTQYEVRKALAQCGLTTKQIESKVMVLSGGEQAKLRLAKIINRPTNVLILDEPTNHLDVEAKEELKRALKEYKGTILMVSHEPEFYNEICSEKWDLSDYTLKQV